MPQLYVHLMAATQLLDDNRLRPLAAEALQRRPLLVKLGSVLPDLPYFAHIHWRALWHLAGFDQPSARWGERFHTHRPMAFAVELARPSSAARLGPLSRLALLAGYLSHVALDTSLHPLVYKLMQQHKLTSAKNNKQKHGLIEKVQAVYLCRDLLGQDPETIEHFAEIAVLGQEARSDKVLQHLCTSAQEVHRSELRPRQWRSWLDGLSWYSRKLRGRIVAAEGAKGNVEALAQPLYADVNYLDRFDSALGRAAAWINQCAEFFEDGDIYPKGLEQLRTLLPETHLDQANDDFADVDFKCFWNTSVGDSRE